MLRNSVQRWGTVAQLFHWGGGALVLFLLGHGWWMVHVAAREGRIEHYRMHASVGYFVLALVIARMVWRWANAVPPHPAGAPVWERVAAQVVHVALYLFLFVESYLGWALAGTLREPLDRTLFGALRVPSIMKSGNRDAHDVLEDAHGLLAYMLAALIVVHAAAALYHWKIRRDDVLQRMLPSSR